MTAVTTTLLQEHQVKELRPCACDCGELIDPYGSRGRLRRYKKNHRPKGPKNHAWRDGIKRHKSGYIQIKAPPNHPHKDHHGYIMEHRLDIIE
jgi:hypothetical protein